MLAFLLQVVSLSRNVYKNPSFIGLLVVNLLTLLLMNMLIWVTFRLYG